MRASARPGPYANTIRLSRWMAGLCASSASRRLRAISRRHAARDSRASEPGPRRFHGQARSRGAANVEHVSSGELALDGDDAHGQQGGTVRDEGRRPRPRPPSPRRAGILECDPQLARRDLEPVRRRDEHRPHALPRARRTSGRSSAPPHMTLRMPAVMRMRELLILVIIPPVPTAVVESPADPMIRASIFSTTGMSSAAEWEGPGGAAVDIREGHAEVGGHEAAHERRERIVVAEFDLVDRRRIVLVDDGDDAELHEARQRVARMQV